MAIKTNAAICDKTNNIEDDLYSLILHLSVLYGIETGQITSNVNVKFESGRCINSNSLSDYELSAAFFF